MVLLKLVGAAAEESSSIKFSCVEEKKAKLFVTFISILPELIWCHYVNKSFLSPVSACGGSIFSELIYSAKLWTYFNIQAQ